MRPIENVLEILQPLKQCELGNGAEIGREEEPRLERLNAKLIRLSK
jgi:hypothetical protein